MSAPPTRPCDGPTCGAAVTFAEGPRGRAIPLVAATDAERRRPGPALYALVGARAVPQREPAPGAGLYVNHFTNCPDRDRFTRPRRA
jgi:hypothetical protein